MLPGEAERRAPYLLAGEEQHSKHSEETQVDGQQQPDAGEVGRSALSASRRRPGSADPAQQGAPCRYPPPAQPLRALWQETCNPSEPVPGETAPRTPGTCRGERLLHQPGPAVRGQPRESWGWGCRERVGGWGRRELSSHSQGRKHMQDGAGARGQGKAIKRAALGARQRPPNACQPTSTPFLGQRK